MASKRVICVLAGRLQPMHVGHLYAYDHLCKKFGKDNVYIATSDKQSDISPLNFKQKRKLATKSFGIPKDKFIKCKVPYVPNEIIRKFGDEDISVVLALGTKDQERLAARKSFQPLTESFNDLMSFGEKTYIYIMPMFANGRNASQIREKFISKASEAQKKNLYIRLFGKFDQEIFDALIGKNQIF